MKQSQMLINTFPYFYPCVHASWVGKWVCFGCSHNIPSSGSHWDVGEPYWFPENLIYSSLWCLSRWGSVERRTTPVQCLHNAVLFVLTPVNSSSGLSLSPAWIVPSIRSTSEFRAGSLSQTGVAENENNQDAWLFFSRTRTRVSFKHMHVCFYGL